MISNDFRQFFALCSRKFKRFLYIFNRVPILVVHFKYKHFKKLKLQSRASWHNWVDAGQLDTTDFTAGMWKQKLEVVTFLWKQKYFEVRSWKRKWTRKHLAFWGAGRIFHETWCFLNLATIFVIKYNKKRFVNNNMCAWSLFIVVRFCTWC